MSKIHWYKNHRTIRPSHAKLNKKKSHFRHVCPRGSPRIFSGRGQSNAHKETKKKQKRNKTKQNKKTKGRTKQNTPYRHVPTALCSREEGVGRECTLCLYQSRVSFIITSERNDSHCHLTFNCSKLFQAASGFQPLLERAISEYCRVIPDLELIWATICSCCTWVSVLPGAGAP